MGYFMIALDHFDYLPEFYIRMYSWLIRMMNRIIEALSGIELLIFREVFFTFSQLVFSYLLILFFVFWFRDRTPKWIITSLICTILFVTTVFVEKIVGQTQSGIIVFHLYKHSLLVNRSGEKGYFFGSLNGLSPRQESLLKDYKREHLSLDLENSKKVKNFFRIGDKRVMVIDHDRVKSDYGFDPDILILMNSPKINLERLLQKMQPKIIVADGSNYFTFKSLWSRTAEKSQITFYDTAKKGAYSLVSSSSASNNFMYIWAFKKKKI